MKIAIVSDDEKTISQHFGRAEKYIVFSFEQGKLTGPEILPKSSHCHSGKHQHRNDEKGRGFGQQSKTKHLKIFENITDCDTLVSRGMGRGAYQDLQELGIQPIITDIADVKVAVQAVVDGTIINHSDKLH